MNRPLPISRLTIHRLAVPLRRKFSHAAAQRACAEPVIVELELADGTVGYGETHPRPYVSGETIASVVETIRELYVPLLVEKRPANFGEAIEAAANLPMRAESGGVVTAARAAVELALLDAYSRAFGRSLDALAGYYDQQWLGTPGSRATARFSAVIAGDGLEQVRRSIRLMRLYRFSHYKLKVGDDEDDARVRAAVQLLGRPLQRGTITLRLDANGGWTLARAVERLAAWEELPIACVEQPLPRGSVDDWAALAEQSNFPLMADESLVTPEDADELIARRAASMFNVRISKNGGLLAAMSLALTAHRHNIECQLGCMVGETSILSAAGRWFLYLVPDIRFAEGSFGRFLLQDDVTRRPIRLGYGGRWRPLSGPGLGVAVDRRKLERTRAADPIQVPF